MEQYEHHGEVVWVRSDLKGKHKEHCLCYECGLFFPDEPENCLIAELNFSVCVAFNVVLPVWECPRFEPKEEA
jgi:hypothetical protein